jgi:superfamily II DNA or RNA helicase
LHKCQEQKNVILDEAHHITEKRLKHLKRINPQKIISLSATIPHEKRTLLRELKSPLTTLKVSLGEAIKNEVIIAPTIHIVKSSLNNEQKDTYTALKKEFDKKLKKWQSQISVKWFLTEYLIQGNKIKHFLSSTKIPVAVDIIKDNLLSKRFICFCSSIEQSKEIAYSLGFDDNNLVNSSKKDSHKILNNFNNHVINCLFVVGMLNEMINLVDIDSGIIVQLDNQQKTTVQKLGRVLRGLLPECYILNIENTRDEVYFKKVLPLLEDLNVKQYKYG